MARKDRYNQESTIPPVTQPRPIIEKRDGHLQVYWKWPLLVALTISIVLSLSCSGLVTLSWSLFTSSIKWRGLLSGIFLFLLVLPLLSTGAFLYAGWQWQGPRGDAQSRQSKPKEIKGPPRLIPVKAKHAQQMAQEIIPPKMKKERRGILSFLKKEKEAKAWVKEFYSVLITVWPSQNLTRANFELLFGGPKYYNKYIKGQNGQQGIWNNWGIVAQTGPRNSWVFCENLPEILARDSELKRYAERMSGIAIPHSDES